MATLEELVVKLTAETSELKAEMQTAQKVVSESTAKMEQAVQKFSENSSKHTSFFEHAMATMVGFLGSHLVEGAFEKIKEGGEMLVEQFTEGIHAAEEEQVALQKLANALSMSGHYSHEAMKDLEEFTKEIEYQTNVSHDAVAANLSLLSSLTKLDAEGLKKAETAAIDMSAAFGIDLETAVRLVAKGVDGNTEAFKRQGVEVEKGVTKAQNLDNILKALSNTSGAAAGVTKTYEGALKAVGIAWHNIFESIGKAIVQNDAVIAVMLEVRDVLKGMTDDADGVNGSLKEIVAVGLTMFLEGLGYVSDGVDLFVRGVTAGLALVQGSFQELITIVESTAGIFSSSMKEAAADSWKAVEEYNNNVKEAFNDETVFGKFGDQMHHLGDTAIEAFSKASQGADSIVEPTTKGTKAVKELTEAQKLYNEEIKAQASAFADQGRALDAEYQFQVQLFQNQLDQKRISEEQYWIDRQAVLDDNIARENAQNLEALQKHQITKDAYDAAELAAARKHNLEHAKIEIDRNKQREENLKSSLSSIATLSESSNHTLAAIGKAAAITQATIDGYAAVQKALAAAPPPFNFALAALVGAATAANVSKIAGVGLNEGGKVMGGGANQDSVQAMLTPGEAVINRSDTERLSKFLDSVDQGGGPGGNVHIEISFKEGAMDYIEAQIIERGRLKTSQTG